MSLESPSPSTPSFFSGRTVVGLLVQTFLYSLLAGWCLGLLPLPAAGWMEPGTLPLSFSVVAVLGAAVSAPLYIQRLATQKDVVGPCIFAAAWQGLLLFFFLQLAARLVPLAANGSLQAALWVFQAALVLQFVARLVPAWYAGIAFFWIAVLPIIAYWIVELVLIGSGNVSWKEMKGANTENAVLVVRALIQCSPFTAVLGALTGSLLDGAAALFVGPMIGLGLLNSILGWRVVRNRAAEK